MTLLEIPKQNVHNKFPQTLQIPVCMITCKPC